LILVSASKWIGGHPNGPGQIEPEGFHRGRSHHADGHLHRAPARARAEQASGYARGRSQQTALQPVGSDDREPAASPLPALESPFQSDSRTVLAARRFTGVSSLLPYPNPFNRALRLGILHTGRDPHRHGILGPSKPAERSNAPPLPSVRRAGDA